MNKLNLDERLEILKAKSNYNSRFNWDEFKSFHKNHKLTISTSNGIQLINSFLGCENCHVGFQLDTYLEGCTHDCKYCYAKLEGEAKSLWNNPIPKPLDHTMLWFELFSFFENNSLDGVLANFFKRKVPIRLGSLSDPFISLEKKLGITKEVISMLNHYKYPYLIVTRSALVSDSTYLDLMDKELASIHISIPSLDEERTRSLEPRAPTPKKRLEAMKILRANNFWVTARINPLFPVVKDGDMVKGVKISNLKNNIFNFYTDELISKISETGCKSILVGMVTMKSKLIDELSKDLNFPLRDLMSEENNQGDFFISKEEIRKLYEHIFTVTKKFQMNFSTCYLGQKSIEYFNHQDLWDNKLDCCNSLNVVPAHKTTSLSVPRHTTLAESIHGSSFLKKIILKLLRFILKHVAIKK